MPSEAEVNGGVSGVTGMFSFLLSFLQSITGPSESEAVVEMVTCGGEGDGASTDGTGDGGGGDEGRSM